MSRRVRIAVALASAAAGALFAWLGWARYATFHNDTFDLAFYARIAWGIPRGEFWEPIVNAHFLGLHASFVLAPLGLLGVAFGTVPVLIIAQSAALALAAWPLARMGQRHLGSAGVLVGALALLLHPNIGHVASEEFHPGTLAVLPIAWAIEACDRQSARALAVSVFGVLICREDLALVTLMIGVVAWRSGGGLRRAGIAVVAVSAVWLLVFALVLHPLLAPAHDSMQLHFGRWGDSVPEAAWHVLTHPIDVAVHLLAPKRLGYLALLLAPVAALPLLRPRWLLVAAPILLMNLLSEWPTASEVTSHYSTPMVPVFVAAAIEGATVLAARLRSSRPVAILAVVCAVGLHVAIGGTPLSFDFDRRIFVADARAAEVPSMLSRIPERASVQAPYALMPHLAERELIAAAPPPERETDYVVLDAWHRERHAHDEALLRTTEEPVVRGWLARSDHGLVAVAATYLLFERGADPRSGVAGRYLEGTADPQTGARIAACLSVLGARVRGAELEIDLVANEACPADLAVRIGTDKRPTRVDLLFDGLLSPAHLRRGDRALSTHSLTEDERSRILRDGLTVGALRSSGARPDHGDPISIPVPLGLPFVGRAPSASGPRTVFP